MGSDRYRTVTTQDYAGYRVAATTEPAAIRRSVRYKFPGERSRAVVVGPVPSPRYRGSRRAYPVLGLPMAYGRIPNGPSVPASMRCDSNSA